MNRTNVRSGVEPTQLTRMLSRGQERIDRSLRKPLGVEPMAILGDVGDIAIHPYREITRSFITFPIDLTSSIRSVASFRRSLTSSPL